MDNNCLMMTVKEFLERESHKYIISEENGSERIIKLPQNRKYSIPAYQREIRWKADNINILINDLRAGKKFLGTILLNKVNDTNYDIIDGQQRISVFILILQAIHKINSSECNLCDFCNKTYEKLFDVMNLDFDIIKIQGNAEKDTYLNSDILEQRERFEIIWKTIKSRLETMSSEELLQFKDNLLYSEINIIFAENRNPRMFVDYYLDLNDKSVKLDNIDILKANLFRIDYASMSSEWAGVQKSIKDFRISGLNYNLSTYYYHYFACSINRQLEYKLTNLKTDLKFTSGVTINNIYYAAGTDILRAVRDQSYFKNAIKELKETAIFLKNAYKKDGLLEIRQKLQVANCDSYTIDNIFSIIDAILRIDNEVPKILIMKYFLDVLNKVELNKKDVKTIYDIYVYSVLFAVTAEKKESSKLIRIVLSDEWIKKLKERTTEFYKNARDKINYYKAITANGKLTETSGQYIPKHIIAIKEFAVIKNNAIYFNEQELRKYLNSSNCSAEHFFINKSLKVSFNYGNNGATAEIKLPKKIAKYISCPVNYLYLDSSVNGDIGNKSIKEKIDLLFSNGENAFVTKKNYEYFKRAKEAFDEITDPFPDLSSFNSKTKAQSAVKKYYNNNLINIMNNYIEKIKSL